MRKTIKPVDAIIAVTYRCNSRCVMCNIWQIKDFPELRPEAYSKLPIYLKDINISRGEPFLRNDLIEIVRIVKKRCPRAVINISSNGFLVEKIKKDLPKILEVDPTVGISISIDGIGKMHEDVRRIPDAWKKVSETLRFCRDDLAMRNVKLAFTLNELNYKQLAKAYNWAKKNRVQFTMAIAHSSENFFAKENVLNIPEKFLHREFNFVIKELIASMSPKDWVRAYFVNGLYKVAKGEKRPLESFPGEDFFYLDPKGDVYPSVADNIIMGNLNDYNTFDELWESDEAKNARLALQGFESNYWMVCTARTGIKRNPLKVANWIFKNKINYKIG
jgi:Fe-coproporphyrin III synthase